MGGTLRILGHDLDEAAGFGVHGGHPHHLGIVLAKTLGPLDFHLLALQVLAEIGDAKCSIQRSKGLGENDPEMMWMTTMNPETRRLIKVMPEDAERTAHYFDVLLGDALQERKNFIAENGAKYLELADIS